MSTQREIIVLDEATPQLMAPQVGADTYLAPATLNDATGNEVAFEIAYTVNKATSGNDTGLQINMTDTASPGTSLLADFQVGGSSKVSINNTGQILSTYQGTEALPAYSFDIGGNKAYGMWYGSGKLHFSLNGATQLLIGDSTNGVSCSDATNYAGKLGGYALPILNRSSSVQENASSQGDVITNSGAGAGTTSTLPSAVAGYHQTFVDNNASYRLTVVPDTGDQLIWTDGTVVSAATGSVVATARYNSFYCVAVDTTTWVVLHATGTWTVTA